MQIRNSLWLTIFVFGSFVTDVALPPVSGLLRVNPKSSSVRLPAKLQILLKLDGKWMGKASVDSAGRFALSLPATGDSAIDFFCIAPGLDTMYLRTVPPFTKDSRTVELLFPCEPDTSTSGDVICPKCKKEDQVYPMVYGDPIVIKRHYDTTGKVSYERLPKKEEQTDTVVRAARYYCRRDKITF